MVYLQLWLSIRLESFSKNPDILKLQQTIFKKKGLCQHMFAALPMVSGVRGQGCAIVVHMLFIWISARRFEVCQFVTHRLDLCFYG